MATFIWHLLPQKNNLGAVDETPPLAIVTVHQGELDDINAVNRGSETDPYAILGIKKTANLEQIKQAYKKLSLLYHPDKQKDRSEEALAAAEEQFKKISAAYQSLLAIHSKKEVEVLQDASSSTILSVNESSMHREYEDAKLNFYYRYFETLSDNDAFDFKTLKNSSSGSLSVDFMDKEEVNARITNNQQKYKDIPYVVTEKAFLWKAEKENCAPIYIFGSLHKSTLDINDVFGDLVDNLVDKVEVVYTEIVMLSLPDSLLKLFGMKTSTQKKVESLDDFIAVKADNQSKTAKHLENTMVREAVGIGSDEDIAAKVNKISEKDLKDFSDNYLTHVSPSIAELDDANNSTAKRNFFWMNDILSTSTDQNKPSLVVCGAAHNAGKYGLPNLLASEGYTLKPMMQLAPTPKSTLIRAAATQGGTSSFFKPAKNPEQKKERAIVPHSSSIKK